MDEIQGAANAVPAYQPPVNNEVKPEVKPVADSPQPAVANNDAPDDPAAAQNRFLAVNGLDTGAVRRFQLEGAVDNQAAGVAPNLQVAQGQGIQPAQAPFVEQYPAARGLQFSETKGASSLAYNARAGEVYRFPDGKEWQVSRVHQTGLTGFRAIELRPTDPNDRRVVLAFAGTDPKSPGDLITDARQALGLGTPIQYHQAAALAGRLQREHGSNLILTGHSLGGGLAAYASMRNGGIPATGVNSAPLVGATYLRGLMGRARNQNITHYNAPEFVSRSPGVQPGQRISVPGRNSGIGGFFSNHGLDNTAPSVPLPTRVR
jgi:hypothetical protein